jgi:hypothetical protein
VFTSLDYPVIIDGQFTRHIKINTKMYSENLKEELNFDVSVKMNHEQCVKVWTEFI